MKVTQEMQKRTAALLNQHIGGIVDENHKFEITTDLSVTTESLITEARGLDTSLTKAVELLEEARDLNQGIKWIRIDNGKGEIPDLIRDARESSKAEAPKNSPESYAIQKLNILRAALKIAELDGVKVVGEKTKNKINELRDNATAALDAGALDAKTQQNSVKKFNTDVVSLLTSIGVKDPAKKLALIKDFMNFEDTHYNISTISIVGGKTVVESETMIAGLTDEQKKSLSTLITTKDGKEQTFEQKVITQFYPEITDGLHNIPTQLRKSLPGLKNAYLKTTYYGDAEKPLEAIASVHHTGAISFHGKGDKQLFTDQNARQLQSFLPQGAKINQNVLNSPANPTGIDSEIHRLTGEAMSKVGGLRSTTPFNFWRKFSRNDNTGHEETLIGLADLLVTAGIKEAFLPALKDQNGVEFRPLQLFSEIATYLKSEANSTLSIAQQALIKFKGLYDNNLESTEFSKTLEHAIEARRIMSNRSIIFDSNNDNLTISAHMASINHAFHSENGIIRRNIQKLTGLDGRETKAIRSEASSVVESAPRLVINCASGKDRTGLAMIMATHFAVCEKLGMDPLNPAQSSEIFKQIVKSGHTQEMASMNAGSRGCHGIKKDTLGAFPAWMQAEITGLQQDTASFNKFKYDPKKVKIDNDLAVEHGVEAPKSFFARLWDSVKSVFSRQSQQSSVPNQNPNILPNAPESQSQDQVVPLSAWVNAEKPITPKLDKSWVAANPSEKFFDELLSKFKENLASENSKNLEADFQGLFATANKPERITKLSEVVVSMKDSDLKDDFQKQLALKLIKINNARSI